MDGDVDPSPHRPSPCPAIRWVRPRQRASPSGSRQTLATGSQSARAVDDDLHRGLAFLPLRVHAVAHADWRVPVLCRPAARAGAARVQLLDHARGRCWRGVHLSSSPGRRRLGAPPAGGLPPPSCCRLLLLCRTAYPGGRPASTGRTPCPGCLARPATGRCLSDRRSGCARAPRSAPAGPCRPARRPRSPARASGSAGAPGSGPIGCRPGPSGCARRWP